MLCTFSFPFFCARRLRGLQVPGYERQGTGTPVESIVDILFQGPVFWKSLTFYSSRLKLSASLIALFRAGLALALFNPIRLVSCSLPIHTSR